MTSLPENISCPSAQCFKIMHKYEHDRKENAFVIDEDDDMCAIENSFAKDNVYSPYLLRRLSRSLIRHKKLNILKSFLEKLTDEKIRQYDRRMLCTAIIIGDIRTYRLLMNYGVKPYEFECEKNPLIFDAIGYNRIEIVKDLIHHPGFKPNITTEGGHRLLPSACSVHAIDIEIIEALIDAGCDPQESEYKYIPNVGEQVFRHSALNSAILAGNDEVVRFLVPKYIEKVDLNSFKTEKDPFARFVLRILLRNLFPFILDHTKDLNSNAVGCTLFRCLMNINRIDTINYIEILLKHEKWDKEKQDSEGCTPFMISCNYGNVNVCRKLLWEFGVNHKITNNFGQEAIDFLKGQDGSIILSEIHKKEEQVLKLLFLTRKFCSDSFFSEDYLPLDMFNEILIHSDLFQICKDTTLKNKRIKIENQ